jgi:hypothetical protein
MVRQVFLIRCVIFICLNYLFPIPSKYLDFGSHRSLSKCIKPLHNERKWDIKLAQFESTSKLTSQNSVRFIILMEPDRYIHHINLVRNAKLEG